MYVQIHRQIDENKHCYGLRVCSVHLGVAVLHLIMRLDCVLIKMSVHLKFQGIYTCIYNTLCIVQNEFSIEFKCIGATKARTRLNRLSGVCLFAVYLTAQLQWRKTACGFSLSFCNGNIER